MTEMRKIIRMLLRQKILPLKKALINIADSEALIISIKPAEIIVKATDVVLDINN
jgi:hypothetical protein